MACEPLLPRRSPESPAQPYRPPPSRLRTQRMDSRALKALLILALFFCAPALRAAAPDEPCIDAYRQDVARIGSDLPASSMFAVLSTERNRCILGPTDTTN